MPARKYGVPSFRFAGYTPGNMGTPFVWDLIRLGLLRMSTRLHSLYHVQKQHMINIRRSPNVQAHSFRLHSLHRE